MPTKKQSGRVADLKTSPYNPRTISDAQLAALAKAMREFGDLGGVVVNVRTGRIVGGHQRVKNLNPEWAIYKKPRRDATGTVAEGMIDTPWGNVHYREVDWPERKEKAANLAANRHHGDFDLERVRAILSDIDDGKIDLDLTGFLADERLDLMGGGSPGQGPADEAPPPPDKAESRPGDLYKLGEHKLLCGDAAKADDVLGLMAGQAADMVFTDPPYGVDYGAKNRFLDSIQRAGRNSQDIKNDQIGRDKLHKILLGAFTNVRGAMADRASFYVTAPQGGDLGLMMMMMMAEAGLPARHVLVWVKNAPTFSMGRLDYDYQHEPILYGWKKKHIFYGKGEHTKSTWFFDKPRASKEHPTMKPVELVKNALLNSTVRGAVVLDTFGGSGTTLLVCEHERRVCRMMELDPRYCDVIVKRWERLTGRRAEKRRI